MQTEEHIEKQDKVLNSLDNKRRMVTDFMAKGEKLMQDPNCPKFLEGHVHKLKEAWEDTNQKAQERKKALAGKKHLIDYESQNASFQGILLFLTFWLQLFS